MAAASNLAAWYAEDSDSSDFQVARRACQSSNERMRGMNLDEEDNALLSEFTPGDSEGVKVRLQLLLSAQMRVKDRTEWQTKTREVFLSFCKFIDKTSTLIQPMLPQAVEWTVTFGVIALIFKAVVIDHTRAETLVEYLDELSASLPLVNLYETIFPTPRMKNAVSRVYASVMKFLDEALYHYHRNRLAKLAQAFFRPQVKFEEAISQVKKEMEMMERIKNAAHEAQTWDVYSTVNQTAEDVSQLLSHMSTMAEKEKPSEMEALIARSERELLKRQDGLHQRLMAVEHAVETINNRMSKFESVTNQMQKHSMILYSQELQKILSSCQPDHLQDWDGEEILGRLAKHEFRLSQKDHWENNGALPLLQDWTSGSEAASLSDSGEALWIGGSCGNQDSWVTELSVDMAQMLLVQAQVTVIHAFCSGFGRASSSMTPISLVRVLIDQLLEKHPEVSYSQATYLSPRRIRRAQTFAGVWEIFEHLVARVGDIFVIIDRIEFLDDEGAPWIHILLPSLLSLVQSTPGLRLIITSEFEAPERPGLDGIYIDTSRVGRMIRGICNGQFTGV